MRDYELTVLLKPSLGEKELDKETKNLQTLLEKAGAKVKSKMDAVKRSLAYEVAKSKDAYYVYLELSVDPTNTLEIEQKLKLDDNLVRYLLIKKE